MNDRAPRFLPAAGQSVSHVMPPPPRWGISGNPPAVDRFLAGFFGHWGPVTEGPCPGRAQREILWTRLPVPVRPTRDRRISLRREPISVSWVRVAALRVAALTRRVCMRSTSPLETIGATGFEPATARPPADAWSVSMRPYASPSSLPADRLEGSDAIVFPCVDGVSRVLGRPLQAGQTRRRLNRRIDFRLARAALS